jgi:hypothetical protein
MNKEYQELIEVCEDIIRIEAISAKDIEEISGVKCEKIVWMDALCAAIDKAKRNI